LGCTSRHLTAVPPGTGAAAATRTGRNAGALASRGTGAPKAPLRTKRLRSSYSLRTSSPSSTARSFSVEPAFCAWRICSSACCSLSLRASVLDIACLHHHGASPSEAACGTQITAEKTGLPECSRTPLGIVWLVVVQCRYNPQFSGFMTVECDRELPKLTNYRAFV